jgi:hypothetical protein
VEVRITALEVNGTTILVKEADYWMYEAKRAGRGRDLPEKNMQQSARLALPRFAVVIRISH